MATALSQRLILTGAGAYAKASYRFGRGAEIVLGLVLELPVTFIWSK